MIGILIGLNQMLNDDLYGIKKKDPLISKQNDPLKRVYALHHTGNNEGSLKLYNELNEKHPDVIIKTVQEWSITDWPPIIRKNIITEHFKHIVGAGIEFQKLVVDEDFENAQLLLSMAPSTRVRYNTPGKLNKIILQIKNLSFTGPRLLTILKFLIDTFAVDVNFINGLYEDHLYDWINYFDLDFWAYLKSKGVIFKIYSLSTDTPIEKASFILSTGDIGVQDIIVWYNNIKKAKLTYYPVCLWIYNEYRKFIE